jgi:uncharacterized protein YdiU (UPF0061 family)
LPEDLPHPRKTLLLLLNFIDTITFFRQYQRETTADKDTGEVLIKTHPEDIELAFALLKNSLFRRADELSTTARGFYNWLKKYLSEAKTNQFTALDVRKAKRIHPRTLNRYLQELTLFNYIQITGGNKYREGYRYKITNLNEDNGLNIGIEKALQATLKNVWNAYGNTKAETETEAQPENENINPQPAPINPPTEQRTKRKRIEEKEEHTLKILLELEAEQPQREYLPEDFTAITGRSFVSEARYLKTLWEQGRLNREWKERKYFYTLATTNSGTAGQTPLTDL